MCYLSKFLFIPELQDTYHSPLWAKVSSKTTSAMGGSKNLKGSHQSVTEQDVNEHTAVTHGASALSALATIAVSFPLTLGDSNYPEASHQYECHRSGEIGLAWDPHLYVSRAVLGTRSTALRLFPQHSPPVRITGTKPQ